MRWGKVSLNCPEARDEGFECRACMLGFVGTGFRVGLGFKGLGFKDFLGVGFLGALGL